MAGKELWFVAEGVDGNSYSVRKKGRSIYITGPNFEEHLCHPSVSGVEKVKREILLVFHEKIVDIKYPGE